MQVREAEDELLVLEVITGTGQARIRNLTGEPLRLDHYEITSASGALQANAWTSLQDQNLPGFPAGNGSGNGWEENGGSGAGRIGESYLAGSSAVVSGALLNLGTAFNTAGARDLVFKYGVVDAQPLAADFDSDGDADGADFLSWQRGLGATGATKALGDADGDADVDAADFAVWRNQFGDTAFSGPSKQITGFVRYINGPATLVPEPGTMWLVGAGLAAIGAAVRRRVASGE